jgi:hypothetical protein
MIMLCLLVKLNSVIDMLYVLTQLRQRYGHVRYAGAVRRCMNMLCLLENMRQECGYCRYTATAETLLWSCSIYWYS